MENKRRREEEESSSDSSSSPEAKRQHADVLLEIFDDEDGDEVVDAGGRGDALAAVMRSLEQEIALAAPSAPPPELGYLLEASDDELGIPPASEERGGEAEIATAAAAAAAVWFADDEIPGYRYDDGLGFGFVRYEDEGSVSTAAAEEELGFDVGPFDYARDEVWIV